MMDDSDNDFLDGFLLGTSTGKGLLGIITFIILVLLVVLILYLT